MWILFYKVIRQIPMSHGTKKSLNLDPNWAFPDCNSSMEWPVWIQIWPVWWPVWIHISWWNDAQSLMLLRRGALLFFKVIRQISKSHSSKNRRIWPSQIGRFRTVTPVWIHQWLRNDAQSLKQHWRGTLLFFKVIRQISRSHSSKNHRIWPRLGVSGLYLQFEITDGYEMMHKAWSRIEEVPYCFSRSSIKFQGHTALKIVKFYPNWAFPVCNSSMNSPMATKWCTKLEVE